MRETLPGTIYMICLPRKYGRWGIWMKRLSVCAVLVSLLLGLYPAAVQAEEVPEASLETIGAESGMSEKDTAETAAETGEPAETAAATTENAAENAEKNEESAETAESGGDTEEEPFAGFSDVSADEWYYDSVMKACSMGLINGVSSTAYEPDGHLTAAECIKLAACIHQLKSKGEVTLTGGSENWYDPYVEYALERKIIAAPFEDYNAFVSRGLVASVFANVIGANEKSVNPGLRRYRDVMDRDAWYYDAVYKLYRYGIMIGGPEGTFEPDTGITRSEIAAVVVRMADPETRVTGDISLAQNVRIPILMYHNFAEQFADYTVTEAIFRSHLTMMKEEGYTAVTFAELIAFAEGRDNLPEKPILLTSDDGYSGVLDMALPLLEEFDMCMSVAVIGEYIGNRGEGQLSHFFLEEEAAADTNDRIELISHSFALHKIENGMRGASNETLAPAEYAAAVSADCAVVRETAGDAYPMMMQVFVYPYGSYSADSEALLEQEGYKATVTTDKGVAVVSPGDGLGLLPRITAEWYTTGRELLKRIK